MLNVANLEPPIASLNSVGIRKLAQRICGGVLVKRYAAHKIRTNKQSIILRLRKHIVACRSYKIIGCFFRA